MSSAGGTGVRVVALARDILDGVLDPSDPDGRGPVDLAIVPWFEDERPLQGLAGLMDWRSGGRMSALVRSGWTAGAVRETLLMPWAHGALAHRVLWVGYGRSADATRERLADATMHAVEVAMRLLPRDVLIALPSVLPDRDLVEAAFEVVCAELRSNASRRRAVTARAVGSDPEPATDVASLRPLWTRCWIVAEEDHVARLRRIAEGPPRAAESCCDEP